MTGPKIPPGGGGPKPPPTTSPGNTGSAGAGNAGNVTTGPQKPVKSEPSGEKAAVERAEPSGPQKKAAGDSFETFRSFARGTTDITRIDDAFAHASSPSGIENLVRMLDQSRAQLAAEHRLLREQAQSVIERLVQSGFAPAQLEKARAALAELRKKMAALRKRLHHLQRRLKSAFASAGKTGDANFAKSLGAQLKRLKNMEPGLSRAMLALSTIEQAYGSFADGSTPVLRVHVDENDVPHAQLGEAIATFAPGAAVGQAALAMLRDGPDAPAPARDEATKAEAPAVLEGMRALGDALLK